MEAKEFDIFAIIEGQTNYLHVGFRFVVNCLFGFNIAT